MTNKQSASFISKIEASIDQIKTEQLTQEEFEDYCDSAYTLICYLKILPLRSGNSIIKKT